MSCYIRPEVAGATLFFSVALAERGGSLLVHEVERLRVAVRQTRAERPFRIDAWVTMPDHLHAVWTLPEGDRAYGVRWGAIKSRFSRSVLRAHGWPKRRVGFHPTDGDAVENDGGNVICGEPMKVGWNPTLRRSASKVAKGDAGIWQRRFWERHVRSEEEFAACVRYCHMNPVKHGFVERPKDWEWSSVHREIAVGRWR